MHNHLIICSDRTFSIINSRQHLIQKALDTGYLVTIVSTGDLPYELVRNKAISYYQLRSWSSTRAIIKLAFFLATADYTKLLVFNTKPLLIVGLILSFTSRKVYKICVFTGLGKLTNLE